MPLKEETFRSLVANAYVSSLKASVIEHDIVQPCDTTQVRSDSDFGIKSATVQVHGNI